MESEVFLVRICVNTQMRLSPFLLVPVPCFVTSANAISQEDVLPSASRPVLRCFQSLSQLALHFSSLSCTCNLTSNAFTLAQDIVPQRKTCCMVAEHGSCPRCVQTTHHGSSSGDNCKLSWRRRSKNSQYAIEQIRILTLQVNSNASAAAAAATTTAPATTRAGSHSQMPKANHQFGKGHHSKHLRRQAEERLSGVGRKFSAVSISTVR